MDFSQKVFSISGQIEFEKLALEIALFQLENCAVYKEYVNRIGIKSVDRFEDIPFLPISFFKSHEIISSQKTSASIVFMSSGTGDQGRSKHSVVDPNIYKRSFESTFESFFGEVNDAVILALLPNYVEQGNSSLVYMVDELIRKSNDELSCFLLNEFEAIYDQYKMARAKHKKCFIIGVAYSLLDLAEKGYNFSEAIVIETGGMKGRRKELSKQTLHDNLKHGLKTQKIYSEYGMTELLSQAYASNDELIFHTPPWMQIKIRDIYDPFTTVKTGHRGALNVIDLANFNSCSFVATEDIGRCTPDGFILEGRMNESEIRGCNLMVAR